jgi:hypothetical protein
VNPAAFAATSLLTMRLLEVSHRIAGTVPHFEVGTNNWSPSRLMNDFSTTLEPSDFERQLR